MKHKFTLDNVTAFVGNHYANLNSSLAVLRVMAIIPLLLVCASYSQFIKNDPSELNAILFNVTIHPWEVVIYGGTLVYILSILLDFSVVLCKCKRLKSQLSKLARYFRVLTYFFVAVNLANFTYRSYVVHGLNPPLHLLLFSTMGLLIILIFFHAYQCKEGLEHGGRHSERHTQA